MLTTANPQMTVLLRLTEAISCATTLDDIYGAALQALAAGLGLDRTSILLFDPDGVERARPGWSRFCREGIGSGDMV